MNFKQTSILLILLLTSSFFISCTQNDPIAEEDTCVGDNYTITLGRYIKKMNRTPVNNQSAVRTSEFTYNEFNLLATEREFTSAYDEEYIFEYHCNNNVSEMYRDFYTYNSAGEIISFEAEGGSHSYVLTHNGQTILAKGKFMSANQEITLELNAANLISKLSRVDSYSTFDYDSDGNLTNAKDYDSNDSLLNEYEIKYDQNPNPFYGQLKSAYLVRFIDFFSDSAALGMSNLSASGDDFRFPYLKNNIISIEEKTSPAPYKFLLENVFTYDTLNYPIKIKAIANGAYNSDTEYKYY